MLRKIKLYGNLAEKIGHKEFTDIAVTNAAQAVSFLINNFPELEPFMSDKYYKVLVNDYELGEDEIHFPVGNSDISFVPVIAGSGTTAKVILGGALIALSFGAGGFINMNLAFGKGFIASFKTASFAAKAAFGIGAGLVLSGVSDMLFPLPKMPEFSSEQDPRLSFNFSGTQQTTRAGTPVPIVYGEIFTGSVVISGAVDTEQVRA